MKQKRRTPHILKRKQPITQPIRESSTSPFDDILVTVLKVAAIGVFILTIMSMIVLLTLGTVGFGMGWKYIHTVATHAHISDKTLLSLMRTVPKTDVQEENGRTNILVLGLDTLNNRDSDTVLTDTILVLSIKPATGTIDTFSFPRDLYIASQAAKINALYSRGNIALSKKTVESISGVSIHYVLPIDITTVGKLIDSIGGIDVDIERSFVDYRFPRTDVDVRVEKNEKNLYEVVAFTKGIEHMTGDRALRFIRSRHSLDPVEGTDDARVRRQQKIITALLAKMKNPEILRRPEDIGSLLGLYNEYIEQHIPITELGAVGLQFVKSKNPPQLRSHQFTVAGNGIEGEIYHPESFQGGAWVYLPADPQYTRMKTVIQSWLTN